MAALDALGPQQTSFSLGLGEMKLKKQMQDDMMRQMTIDSLIQYLRTSYEKRHAEARQRTMQQQAMVTRGLSMGAALVASPIAGAFSSGAAASTGSLDAALPANGVSALFTPGGPGYSPVGMIGY